MVEDRRRRGVNGPVRWDLVQDLTALYNGRLMKLIRSKYPTLYRVLLRAGFDDDDIEQFCVVGAAHASRKYDPDHTSGAKFESYACDWMRQSCQRAVASANGRRRLAAQHLSLDRECGESGTADEVLLPGVTDPDPIDHVRDELRPLLEYLSPDDRAFLAARYGLDGRPAETCREMAKAMGVSWQAIQQRDVRLCERLKRLAEIV